MSSPYDVLPKLAKPYEKMCTYLLTVLHEDTDQSNRYRQGYHAGSKRQRKRKKEIERDDHQDKD